MSAKVCTIFNQKGGVGKTNISVNLAYEFGKSYRTLLIDLDPQGSASDWVANAPDDKEFPAAVMNLSRMGVKVVSEIRKHVDNYDYIFVDSPPSVEQKSARAALLVSDAVLIPVTPTPTDMWASDQALELIEEINISREGSGIDPVKVLMLASRVKRTKLAESVIETLKQTEGITFMNNFTTDLTAYSEAPAYGVGVSDVPGATKAAEEMAEIVKEVQSHLQD